MKKKDNRLKGWIYKTTIYKHKCSRRKKERSEEINEKQNNKTLGLKHFLMIF